MTREHEPVSEAHEAALIRNLDAETEELRLQHELRRAEVRKTLAEAAEAEAGAAIREISRAERQRAEEINAIQDHFVFEHYFAGPVDNRNVFDTLQTLAAWDRQYPECPMNITINSPGGSVTDGMHLFDQLHSYSLRGGGRHKVTITVRGYAASMGAILVQAGDVRRIGSESYMLVHEVSAGAYGKIGELKDSMKWYDKICARIAALFVERSGSITLEKFVENWSRADWWLDSAEALELGFVDEIG